MMNKKPNADTQNDQLDHSYTDTNESTRNWNNAYDLNHDSTDNNKLKKIEWETNSVELMDYAEPQKPKSSDIRNYFKPQKPSNDITTAQQTRPLKPATTPSYGEVKKIPPDSTQSVLTFHAPVLARDVMNELREYDPAVHTMWPPERFRLKHQILVHNIGTQHSSQFPEQGHNDAYWALNRPAIVGECIMVYGSKLTQLDENIPLSERSYMLSLLGGHNDLVIDAHPKYRQDPWSKAGFINSPMGQNKPNCKFLQYGVIVATQPISPGERLLIDYGDDYHWGDAVLKHLSLLKTALVQVHEIYGSPATDKFEAICSQWDIKDIQVNSTTLERAVLACVQGRLRQLGALHRCFPIWEGSIEQWMIDVIRCEPFYQAVAWKESPNNRKRLPKATLLLFAQYKSAPTITTRPKRGVRIHLGETDTVATLLYEKPPRTGWEIETDESLTVNNTSVSNESIQHIAPPDEALWTPPVNMEMYDTSHSEKPLSDTQGLDGSDTAPSLRGAPDGLLHNNYVMTTDADLIGNKKEPLLDSDASTVSFQLPNQTAQGPQITPTTSDVKIATWNCNHLTNLKLEGILEQLRKHDWDILHLVDTRLTKSAARYLLKSFRNLMLDGMKWCITEPLATGANTAVGGSIVLYTTKLQLFRTQELMEGGSLVEHRYRVGQQLLYHYACYWPCQTTAEQGMLKILQDKLEDNPIDIIKAQMEVGIRTARQHGASILLTGDFNTDTNKEDRYNLSDFISRTCLHGASDELSKQPSYSNAKTKGTRLDYIFSSLDIDYMGGGPMPLPFTMEDHKPITATIQLCCNTAKPPILKRVLSPDINLSNEHHVRHMDKLLADVDTATMGDGEEFLRNISVFTAKEVENLYQRKVKMPYRSSTTVYLNVGLRNIILIRRHLLGMDKRTLWTSDTYADKLSIIVKRWQKQTAKIIFPDGSAAPEYLYDHNTWEGKTYDETQQHMQQGYSEIKRLVNSSYRRDKRTGINAAIQKRERKVESGKYKGVIDAMLDRYTDSYNMETLDTPSGIETSAEIIHTLTSEHFEKWMSDPGGSETATLEQLNWQKWCRPWEDMKTEWVSMGIPETVCKHIWNGLQYRVDEDTRLQMRKTLLTCPTMDEFTDAIQRMPKDSVGGRNGLTYNMMKLWPHHIRSKVHQILAEMWSKHEFPQYWKEMWLVPIPKKDSPTLDDLRPLMLTDALRKTWMSIFVHRIQTEISQRHLLDEAQHGSIRGRTIDSNNTQFVNIIETAQQTGSPLYVTSFDKRRAFDSVPKSLLIWCWIRVGVPEELATYMVSMDIGSNIVVRSPFALQAAKAGNESTLGFCAQRGIVQGDGPAPLGWDCVYDTLLVPLTMRRHEDVDNYRIADGNGNIKGIRDTAFVDDLFAAFATLSSANSHAMVVSAWCNITTIGMAFAKLRAVKTGNTGIKEDLIVYDQYWRPIAVPFAANGSVEYLGIVHDIGGGGLSQWNLTVAEIRTSVAKLWKKKASATLKWLVISISLYEKIAYSASLCPWTIREYEALDKLLRPLFRSITKNLQTFPNQLIHMARPLGLGFTSISDFINERKKSKLDRLLHGSAMDKAVMESLLKRAAEELGATATRGHWTILQVSENVTPLRTYWATSLLQYLQSLNIYAAFTGNKPNPANTLVSNLPMLTIEKSEILPFLCSRGIATLGEYYMEHDTIEQVHPTIATHWKPSLCAKTSPLQLRTGQIWSSTTLMNQGRAFEIMGFTDNEQIEIVEWNTRTKSRLEIGKRVYQEQINNLSTLRGAGAIRALSREQVQSFTHLITLSPEAASNKGIHSIVEGIRTRSMSDTPRPNNAPPPRNLELETWLVDAQSIYIQVQRKDERTFSEWIRTVSEGYYRVGISKYNESTGWEYGFCEIPIVDIRPLSVELLVLLMIIQASTTTTTIHTSTKAAYNAYIRSQSKKWIATDESPIITAMAKYKRTLQPPCRKTEPSHNDIDTIGRKLAKEIASAKYKNIQPHKHLIKEWNLSMIQDVITCHNSVVLTRNGQLFMGSTRMVRQTRRLEQYTSERDEWRNKRGAPAKWRNTSLRLAAECITGITKVSQHARELRAIWDKYLFNNKRMDYGIDALQDDDNTCKWCNNIDSLSHIINHCKATTQIQQIRQKATRDAQLLISQCDDHKPFQSLITDFNNLIKSKGTHLHWLGVYENSQLQPTEKKYGNILSNSNFKKLVNLQKLYYQAARNILDIYLDTETNSSVSRLAGQTTIDDWILSQNDSICTEESTDAHYWTEPIQQEANNDIAKEESTYTETTKIIAEIEMTEITNENFLQKVKRTATDMVASADIHVHTLPIDVQETHTVQRV